jgi:hypothetical protein
MHPIITAQIHLDSLQNGSSKPQIFADENLNQWVVKSAHSFQGPYNGRLLFNEYVATRIAETIGMPVFQVAAISITPGILSAYPFLADPNFGAFSPGLHFAISYKPGYPLAQFIQSGQLQLIQSNTTNKTDANGIMAFDTWACNVDRAVDYPGPNHHENPGNLFFETIVPGMYRMIMIDHGIVFTGDWHDDPNKIPLHRIGYWALALMGHLDVFFKNQWADLAQCLHWVQGIQALTLVDLQTIVSEVPLPWKAGISQIEIDALLACLLARAHQVGTVITQGFPQAQHFALARP